jgi:hypothetical protein
LISVCFHGDKWEKSLEPPSKTFFCVYVYFNKNIKKMARHRHTPVITALGRLRQEDLEFEATPAT